MALGIPVSRSDPTPLSGMAMAAMAFALLTATDTIFKLMAENHPVYQILFINGCFAVIPIIGWALATGGLQRVHTERPFQHLGRGAVGLLSGYCAVIAYSRLPLADFYAIVFSGPLIVTALSVFWLKEKIDRIRWLAIGVGFVGILIVTHPFSPDAPGQNAAAALGRLAAILSVSCYALSMVMVRRMRLGESNLTFSLYGYIVSTIFGGIILLIGGGPELHISDFAHLVLSGLISGIASICLMTAYHRSPVAIVAPFQYTQIFWGALAGWLLWQHVPDRHLWAGAAIIAASGLFLIYREIRLLDDRQLKSSEM